MSCPKAKIALLLAFFGCFSSPADAQINLKTGYNLSFLSVSSLDNMLSEYNDSKGYSSGFNNLRWLHGFEGGIRFKSGLQAIEVNYQGAYQALNATGSVSGSEFED